MPHSRLEGRRRLTLKLSPKTGQTFHCRRPLGATERIEILSCNWNFLNAGGPLCEDYFRFKDRKMPARISLEGTSFCWTGSIHTHQMRISISPRKYMAPSRLCYSELLGGKHYSCKLVDFN